MIRAEVTLDSDLLLRLQDVLKKVGAGAMVATNNAFHTASCIIQSQWQGWAMGQNISGARKITRPSGRLAQSIKIKENASFDFTIYTDSPYMKRIQEGSNSFDMKKVYPYGNKSRVGKDKNKTPYLIIPFKWGTPGGKGENGERAHFGNTIDIKSYAILKSRNFARYKTTGKIHLESNAKGELIPRQEYTQGDFLTKNDTANNKEIGMVKTGEDRHTAYMTFRIISAKSPSNKWIRKGVPPNDVVGALQRKVSHNIENMLKAALIADLTP